MADFRTFCMYQIERLTGAFPDMRFYKAAALEELANWLEAKAKGDEHRAAELVTEVTEFAEIPSISAMNAVWARMFPPPIHEAKANCADCDGTGWVMVKCDGGEAAKRCKCGPPPSSDPGRMRELPKLTQSEKTEMRRLNERFAAELSESIAPRLRVPVAQSVTDADIQSIKAQQERNRGAV